MRAQKESDRLGAATSDVVNLRSLVSSRQVQKTAPSRGGHATKKKSAARLDAEIVEALAEGSGASKPFEEAKAAQALIENEVDSAGGSPARIPPQHDGAHAR